MTKPANLPASFIPLSFGAAVRAAMQRNPAKPAVIFGEQVLSYADLVQRADQLRNAALQLGLGRGDVAAVIARNCIEYIEIVCGIPDACVGVATINPRLAPNEIKVAVEDSRAKLIFTDLSTKSAVLAAGIDPSIRIVTIGLDYETFLSAAPIPKTLPEVQEWDVWTIPYTSGTTGKPKGVLLSHRCRMLVGLISATEFGCFGPDGKFLAMTPMNHGGGLGFPAACLSTGGTIEIMDKFEPRAVLHALKHHGITGIFMVPTHFKMIFDLPEDILQTYARPPITSIIANAAPLSQAMKEKIVPYFGETVLHEIYSSTESGLVCNLRPADQLRKQQCVGLPFAHTQVEIRLKNGEVCGPDEIGELFSRSPLHFNGYWHRPDETAEAFSGEWLSVGDMAKRDSEGFIYIVDRKKDMVISGGVNIYPREIEEILLRHPKIADIAVIGIPDETWGETLKAFVVTRDQAEVTARDILEFCAGKLAPYKIPKLVSAVAELPRNANGKVLKRDLRLQV